MKPIKVVSHAMAIAVFDREITVPHRVALLPDNDDAETARILADADVLVFPKFKAAWRSPSGCTLGLVHSTGAGIDAIEIGALPPGCKVCNVYGHERGVTEQAVLLMLALQKNVFAFDAALRRGNWTPERPFMREMRKHNLLILGLGHIGLELARWGNFMEMNVTALTRSPEKLRRVPSDLKALGKLSEIDSYLPAADFVVVAVPATPETTDLIGEKQLQRMKPTAFIVNVGRGAVINEQALYEALQAKRIGGAGLDVWYRYPVPGEELLPSRFPFQELKNVIMTPHKATSETVEYRFPEIAKNIDRFARGEPLVNQVWPVIS